MQSHTSTPDSATPSEVCTGRDPTEEAIDATFELTSVHCADAARALNRKAKPKFLADKRVWLALAANQKSEYDVDATLQLIHATYPGAEPASVARLLAPTWPESDAVAAAFSVLRDQSAARTRSLKVRDAELDLKQANGWDSGLAF